VVEHGTTQPVLSLLEPVRASHAQRCGGFERTANLTVFPWFYSKLRLTSWQGIFSEQADAGDQGIPDA